MLDDAKHALEWPSPYNAPPKIVADGEKLQFMITEAIERKEHKPTIDEEANLKLDRWWSPPQWDYTSTGRLRLTLESCECLGISHSWADGKRRKLDTCLGKVLITCQKMAAAIKKEREDRVRHRRDLERQRARELEAREREEEYLRKSEVIKKTADSLELSQGIRRLVEVGQFSQTWIVLKMQTSGSALSCDNRMSSAEILAAGHRSRQFSRT